MKPDERVRTLVGNRIMMGSEVARQAGEKPNWVRPEDLSPEGRVRMLDRAGIDGAVLSPNSPAIDLVWFPNDPQLAAAYCRAQNSYMAYFSSEFPERLKWAGLIPWQDRDLAIEELRRTAEMGMKGINFKAVPLGLIGSRGVHQAGPGERPAVPENQGEGPRCQRGPVPAGIRSKFCQEGVGRSSETSGAPPLQLQAPAGGVE